MEKKTIATSMFCVLILIFIVSIGATLSAFKVSKEKVEVKSITVEAGEGVLVADKDGNAITSLKVKSSKIGVRPATGEEDGDTGIPSTINDAVGTEGAYATFFVSSDEDFVIVLNGCTLTQGSEDNLDNVKIAVMDDSSKTVSGTDMGAVIISKSACKKKEMSIVVWLDADTTKTVAGADVLITIGIQKK